MSGTMHGRTADGRPVDDDMIERLADEAERGFDRSKWLGGAVAQGGLRWVRRRSLLSRCGLILRCVLTSPGEPRATACLSQRSSAGRWGSTSRPVEPVVTVTDGTRRAVRSAYPRRTANLQQVRLQGLQ